MLNSGETEEWPASAPQRVPHYWRCALEFAASRRAASGTRLAGV